MEEESKRRESEEDGTMKERSKRCNIADFEDEGRRPWAEECGQPLETAKGKETDPSLKPPEGMQPRKHLDFSPVKPM